MSVRAVCRSLSLLTRAPARKMTAQVLADSSRENAKPAPAAKRLAMEPLRVKKLSEHATLPKRGSAGAAGYDLARRAAHPPPPTRRRRRRRRVPPPPPQPPLPPDAHSLPPSPPPPPPSPSARSAEDATIPARGKGVVKTDLAIAVPPGTYGRVAPRSGLAVKNFVDTGAGVVDEDYRGNVGVVLFNHGDADFVGARRRRPFAAGLAAAAAPLPLAAL